MYYRDDADEADSLSRARNQKSRILNSKRRWCFWVTIFFNIFLPSIW